MLIDLVILEILLKSVSVYRRIFETILVFVFLEFVCTVLITGPAHSDNRSFNFGYVLSFWSNEVHLNFRPRAALFLEPCDETQSSEIQQKIYTENRKCSNFSYGTILNAEH